MEATLQAAPYRRREVAHRPFPPPRLPAEARMVWEHALFLHWRIGPGAVPLPAGLDPDVHDGSAWVSLVAFRMREKRSFAIPLARNQFPEVNVRTYVRRKGQPGIRFLSMDTPEPLVGWVGRRMGFPYRRARIVWGPPPEGQLRDEAGAGAFSAAWEDAGPCEASPLDLFLTERYAAFAGKAGRPTLHVHHAPWPLRRARVEVRDTGFLRPLVGDRQPDHAGWSPGVEAGGWLRP